MAEELVFKNISSSEINNILSLKKSLKAIERGLIYFNQNEVLSPERIIETYDSGLFLTMPSAIPKNNIFGTKFSILQPNKKFYDGEIYKSIMMLMKNNELKKKVEVFSIDARPVTEIRTAAVIITAFYSLVKNFSNEISIIGAGKLAKKIVQLLCEGFSNLNLYVYEYDENVKFWCDDLLKNFSNVSINLCSLEDCLMKKNIIMSTSTTNKVPIVDSFKYEYGQTILSLGGASEGAKEFSSELLKNSIVVVDSLKMVFKEAGEFKDTNKKDIEVYSLDELISSKYLRKKIKNSNKNKIFKTVGLGYLDLFCMDEVISTIDKNENT